MNLTQPDTPRPVLKALTPALITQIANAIIAVLTAFEIVTFTPVQLAAIAGLLTVIGLVLTTIGVLSAEGQVTPTNQPTLASGTEVTVTTPPGQPDTKVTV